MNFRYVSAVFLLIFSVASTYAVEVSKDSWIDDMTTAIPAYFCQSEQYFRQCFEVSAEKCEEVATSSARVCLSKSEEQIPNLLNQPNDGTKWGTVVGTCAGKSYEIALINTKIRNAKCNDANNWR